MAETDIVTVSDASGVEAIEVHRSPGDPGNGSEHSTGTVLDIAGLGRVVEMVPSPDGSLVAITNHQFQLFVVAVASGEQRLVDESAFGRIEGPSWSPDGKWVAYSYPASAQTRQVKLGDVDGGHTFAVTGAQFRDSLPLVRPDRELPLLSFAPDLRPGVRQPVLRPRVSPLGPALPGDAPGRRSRRLSWSVPSRKSLPRSGSAGWR